MNLETKFEINPLKVISEMLDGETIIINLETGTYFSMNETASFIWEDIQSGYSINKITEHIGMIFTVEEKEAEQSVVNFIELLEKDGLVTISEGASDISVPNVSEAKKPYLTPTIEKYEDMQEMLLADPIHDVDTAGWPKRKQD